MLKHVGHHELKSYSALALRKANILLLLPQSQNQEIQWPRRGRLLAALGSGARGQLFGKLARFVEGLLTRDWPVGCLDLVNAPVKTRLAFCGLKDEGRTCSVARTIQSDVNKKIKPLQALLQWAGSPSCREIHNRGETTRDKSACPRVRAASSLAYKHKTF